MNWIKVGFKNRPRLLLYTIPLRKFYSQIHKNPNFSVTVSQNQLINNHYPFTIYKHEFGCDCKQLVCINKQHKIRNHRQTI